MRVDINIINDDQHNMNMNRRLGNNIFRIIKNIKSKECSLCTQSLSHGSHCINAQRALYFYHKHKLLLHPERDRLCLACHSSPIHDLELRSDKIDIVNATNDTNMTFRNDIILIVA